MRSTAYGQRGDLTFVDRFGVWLSERSVRRAVSGRADGGRTLDLGSGYEATLLRRLAGKSLRAVAVDIDLAPELAEIGIESCPGTLPGILKNFEDESFDAILAVNVLEHLDDVLGVLIEIHRLLATGGVAFINVPSWRGKTALEFSAFRLGMSPPDEIDDHRRYFDPRDLWPLLVNAGFRPSSIRCRRHKLGLNTYAVCSR